MSWKLRVALSALLLAPQAVLALGLGDIRVNSALNEPLSAEIELVAPTNEELNSMGAQLASRELFQRYGLDRPAFLDSLQFAVGRGRDGRNVLLVSSTGPASEPFVTFLVELNWPRGRLLREYTVLLDPPVFAPKEAVPPAPVAAPRVSRPVAAPAPVAAAAPAPVQPAPAQPEPVAARPAAAAGTPSSYRVERGDTAYGIALRLSGGDRATANKTMIAMFRANPDAFGGNINLLLAGAILRVPGPEAVDAVSGGEAAAEISRQTTAWHSGESVPEAGRLRLVTPSEATPEVAPAADLETRIGQVNREVEESKRLLEIKQAELAQLQNRLAEQEAAAKAAEAAAPGPEPAAEAPAAEAPAAGEAPVAEAPTPAAAPEPEPTTAAERKPAPAGPSFLESLTDNWTYMLGAAALLLVGGLAWGYVRRRREEDLDEALRSFELPATPVPSETQRLRALAMAESAAKKDIVVEERKRPAKPSPARPKPEPSVDDTISTEAAIDLDEGDPLAEADFHMAYGLYDQSADIIQAALEKEPDRRDYKVKLLEIFFVAGNAENFLEVARDLSGSRGEGDAVEWNRIAIMGRQLAPEDPLFEGAEPGGRVDLNLEGGASRVDLELLAMPEGEEGVDLDLGEALGAADSGADTGENTALDLDLDAAGEDGPPTVEMAAASVTAEMPTFELPAGDAPTVKSPRIREGTGDTIRQQVSPGRMGMGPVSADTTAEMEMDDLGIDLSDFEMPAEGREQDDPTQLMPKDDAQTPGGTAILPALKDDADQSGTALLPELAEGLGEIDLELPDELAGAGADDGARRVDLDIGAPADGDATATERMSLSDLPQMSELEPVTMSEVGTKLDLARAYVDMGDPDGARSILQEVLQEGSSQQKQDAKRLLDSLPGA